MLDISSKMSVSGEVRKTLRNTQNTKKKALKSFDFKAFGRDKLDRTADLLNAMASLVYTNEYNPSISSKESILIA